jgi:riboflavin kinase / FMN adenylyltransferase
MHTVSQLAEIATREPAILTIGFFDGVHRGHQALVRRVSERAARESARAVLVTFWPHPLTVLQPDEPLSLLTMLDEKLERVGALGGLDLAVVLPFTTELSRLSPEQFLDTLRERFDVRGLVEGPDFAFGHNRAGDVSWLRRAGAARGFDVETLQVDAGGARISSTRIRDLIARGGVIEATELLGYPYMLTGEVIEGDQRGRLLGFPTANLRLDPVKLLPANGVYAVRVRLPADARPERPGVANIGVRPTIGEDNRRLLEVHLLDAQLDLYGQRLTVEIVARLRDEQRFPGLDALKAQIAVDADQARALLTTHDGPSGRDPGGSSSSSAQARE